MKRAFTIVLPCLALLYASASSAPSASVSSVPSVSQPPAAFRSRITLVPVDVRVLDRNGAPIADLKQSDFTVLEDGTPQEIAYFEAYRLTPEGPRPGGAPATAAPAVEGLAPRNQRVFLLVLGRGRLQDPATKAIDAAIRFVRQSLLPQDRVAVLAYNRATAFTSNHEETARLLERFRQMHFGIEARLELRFSGLAGVYGSKEIPRSIQADVDAIFHGAGANVRQIAPAGVTDAARAADDARRNADALMRGEILSGREVQPNEADRTFDLAAAERIDLPFDEYVSRNVQSMQDLGNVYTGIEYMRSIEGEKHLVFVTERGVSLPRLEDDKSLAAIANDARVAIDVVHTAGFPPPRLPQSAVGPMGPRRPGPLNPLPTATMLFDQGFQVQTSRTIANLTGGQATAYRTGEDAFNRIDRSTRFEYLLGYYPSNGAADGRYRRITVTVKRRDAVLQFRHGYFARRQAAPFDRRAFLTESRMAAAANYGGAISDLGVTLTASRAAPADVLVSIAIAPARVAFKTDADGRHAANLEVLFFCVDAKGAVVGVASQTIDMKLREEVYQKFLREGVSYTKRIRVDGEASFVKTIVYDYAADLLGSVVARVQ